MITARRSLFLLAAVVLLTPASHAAEDLVLSNKFDEVTAAIFIPGDVPVLRGLYVHAANYTLKPDDRWAEAGRAISFGHLALDIDRRLNNRPQKLRQALDLALPAFAAQSGHRELPNLALAGTGHSAGGWVTQILLKTPERAIATAIDCAWVVDPAKLNPADKSVPMLFTLGAIPDAFNMLPDVEKHFLPARQQGYLWGLGLQWGCAHDFGNAAALMLPWLNNVIAARLPADASALDAAVNLRDLRLEDGWLGDLRTISNTWAAIAPWAEFAGDRSKAAWFPNRAVAFIWRAWQTKNSPVAIQARVDGSAQLPPWNPKATRDLMVNPGVAIQLAATVRDGLEMQSIQFFDGDRLIGESASAPWLVMWHQPTPGAHALHAVWTAREKQQGAVNPALVIVRSKAKQ